MLKIVISYDMNSGKEEECQRYFSQVIGPALRELGMNMAEVWYTIWGDSPQIRGGGLVKSIQDARRILESRKWEEAVNGFRPLVTNFQVRVVTAHEHS